MGDAALLDEIRSLLDAPPAASGGPGLDRIEEVLTDGYARALALEAEHWRLERRLGELAVELSRGSGCTDELSAIARRMSSADRDLVRLRSALASLRVRASEARAA